MKLNIFFVATALAYGSSLVAGLYYDRNLFRRDVADVEELDARDFHDGHRKGYGHLSGVEINGRDFDEDFEDVFVVRLDSYYLRYWLTSYLQAG